MMLPETILAIDPGNKHSAYAVVNTDSYRPIAFGKVPNDELRIILKDYIASRDSPLIVIETMISLGQRVGSEVFDTCIFIGRLSEMAEGLCAKVEYVTRLQEKMTLCGTMKVNDTDIRRALIFRFAPHDGHLGKGTKKKPGWFRGFKEDMWSAYGIGVTFLDGNKNLV